VAERANDEILQLAGQGNLQALSVYLNRHLIPSGAHVKVKQKDEALHILIVVMSESDHSGLIKSVQNLLLKLQPTHIKRVKVYTQVLGQKQASLRQQFLIPAIAESQSVTAPTIYLDGANSTQPQESPSQPAARVAFAQGTKKTEVRSYSSHQTSSLEEKPSPSLDPTLKKRRYSVAEFLAQANNIEDLRVLADHPFFTGRCPHCGHLFAQSSSPPTYWDCPNCGWQDDLSSAIPAKNLADDKNPISLTESKRLGDYLVEAGLLTEAQIEVALADQATTSLRFGEVLIRRGWVKEETIEYLMQKVILPERTGHENTTSYLESSRNLLKTLLKIRSGSQGSNSLLLGPPTFALENSASMQDLKQAEQDNPQSIAPPVVPQAPPTVAPQSRSAAVAPKATPLPSGKLANERETLILPDVELDELDSYLNEVHNQNKG
jgi:rubrerythrin